jgi:hypothetical protein
MVRLIVVFIMLKMMMAVREKCLICSVVIGWLERREYRKRTSTTICSR